MYVLYKVWIYILKYEFNFKMFARILMLFMIIFKNISNMPIFSLDFIYDYYLRLKSLGYKKFFSKNYSLYYVYLSAAKWWLQSWPLENENEHFARRLNWVGSRRSIRRAKYILKVYRSRKIRVQPPIPRDLFPLAIAISSPRLVDFKVTARENVPSSSAKL